MEGTRPRWRILLSYARPHRWRLLGGGLLGFAGGVAGLAQPLVAKTVIDAFGGGQGLAGPLITLGVLVVVGAVISAAGMYVLERTGQSIVLAARRQLIGRMLRLPVPEVDRLKPGDLLSRVSSDTTLLQTVTTNSLVDTVNGLFIGLGAIILMGIMDPVLLAVSLGVLVVIGGGVMVIMPKISRATERAQAAVGEMGATLERALGAFRTVKASGIEAAETEVVGKAAEEAWRRGVQVAGWTALTGIAGGLAIQVAFLAVLGVGGARVASGAMEVSTLVAFLLYLFYLTEPIAQLVQAATQLQAGLAAVARMREIEDLPAEPVAPVGPAPAAPASVASAPAGAVRPGPAAPAGARGEGPGPRATAGDRPAVPAVPAGPAGGPASVRFEGVAFRYREDRPRVHDGLSFEVPAGSVTALVGPSGAGKSTVFALLERFYEPEEGAVLVDGRDARDWPLAELRGSMGYVEQDTPILAGTLRDNLVLAAPGATEDEVREVVRLTRLEPLVERLPDGLDSQVGHRGTALSGGERQRVAIARALLRRPRLLLLDEATSQLDAVNELAMRDVVEGVAGETTVMVIAHRLSTVTSADQIVVLEAGRLRAAGTHDELVELDALYRTLASTQLLVSQH
ncbi:ABC transporter ATP-binding protein [Bailinhaonella thermotolerans]|uniref:ABC transporter ATP-binding protein n=1 Tax=Bailinhaonella thermotolerans TaxID=1070861 RepID=A0A3A4B1V8_9ACTN|nr:ABC transporter ATP-binding protein [Bailinhaonella thermotolerans]RJL34158.1 ABC transporter ATP-binding protein [Bailinhaonella thermotolerans]